MTKQVSGVVLNTPASDPNVNVNDTFQMGATVTWSGGGGNEDAYLTWQYATVSGGPYNDIPTDTSGPLQAATNPSGPFTADATEQQVTITALSGGTYYLHVHAHDIGESSTADDGNQVATVTGAGTDNLTADDVSSASSVNQAAIGQSHALTASDASSASSVSAPAVGQIHALLADNVASASSVSQALLDRVEDSFSGDLSMWAERNGASGRSISSGKLTGQSTGTDSLFIYQQSVGSADQWIKFTISTFVTGTFGGGILRSANIAFTSDDVIGISIDNSGHTIYWGFIDIWESGSNTGSHSIYDGGSPMTFTNGDTIAVSVTGTGSSIEFKLWKNPTGGLTPADWGTPNDTWGIAGFTGGTPPDTGNYIGMYQHTADTSMLYDDFSGGLIESTSVDSLTANDVTSASSVSQPDIGQKHAITADDATSGTDVSAPAITQEHALLAENASSGSNVSEPAAHESNVLLADDVTSGSSVTTPAIGQSHSLTVDDASSASSATAPAVGQEHVLLADDAYSASNVTSPAISQEHALLADDVSSASNVSAPDASESNLLQADDISSGSSVTAPVIGQHHYLTADDVNSALSLTSPDIGQEHSLAADNVSSASNVSAPTVTGTGVAQNLDPGFISSGSSLYEPSFSLSYTINLDYIPAYQSYLTIDPDTGDYVVDPETGYIEGDTDPLYKVLVNNSEKVSIGFISATTILYDPVASPGAYTLSADFISAVGTLFTPGMNIGTQYAEIDYLITYPGSTLGDFILDTNQLSSGSCSITFEPYAYAGPNVKPDYVSPVTTIYSPTLQPGSVTISADFISAVATVYDPDVFNAQVVSLDYISPTTALYDPAVELHTKYVSADYISPTTTLYDPTASVGSITLSADYIDETDVYDVHITNGQRIDLDLISSTTLYEPNFAQQLVFIPDTLYQALFSANEIGQAFAYGEMQYMDVPDDLFDVQTLAELVFKQTGEPAEAVSPGEGGLLYRAMFHAGESGQDFITGADSIYSPSHAIFDLQDVMRCALLQAGEPIADFEPED